MFLRGLDGPEPCRYGGILSGDLLSWLQIRPRRLYLHYIGHRMNDASLREFSNDPVPSRLFRIEWPKCMGRHQNMLAPVFFSVVRENYNVLSHDLTIILMIFAVANPVQNPADSQLAHASGLFGSIAASILIVAQKTQMNNTIVDPNHS